jgi:hypothetical protein
VPIHLPLVRERRADLLFRAGVHTLQQGAWGFQVDVRGSATQHRWIQLTRHIHQGAGGSEALVILLAHGQREGTVMADAYLADGPPALYRPRRQLVHRYAPVSQFLSVVQQLVQSIRQ